MNAPPLKELLGLHDFTDPELYERGQSVRNSPYAGEIRKAMSELDLTAMFCIKGTPQIAILKQAKYEISQVLRAHAALWNQGLASILIVMAEDYIRVFSLAKAPKASGDGSPKQFHNQCLLETLKAAEAAISLKKLYLQR